MQIHQSDAYARFSPARLSAYESLARSKGHDFTAAWDLYVWNTRVAGAFMPLLQTVEVVLRNAIAEAFIATHGGRWLAVPGFQRSLPTSYAAHVQELLKRKQGDVNAVMPDLKFAFWEGLLTARHDARVWSWHSGLSFPGLVPGTTVRDVHAAVESVRRFRNRVAHGEPLLTRQLAADRDAALELMATCAPVVAAWARVALDPAQLVPLVPPI